YIQTLEDGRTSFYGPGALRTFSVSEVGYLTLGSAEHEQYTLEVSPSGNLKVYNPNIGGTAFEIRENNGRIRSEGTRLNETTNAVNLRIGNGTGEVFMVTSTKENKLVAGKVSSNPYDILKVDVLDWYDLNNTEQYADLLTRQQNGE